MFCTDGFRSPFGGSKRKVITATCISGNNFDIDGHKEILRDVRCNGNVYSDTKITKRKCVAGYTAEIGFNVEGQIEQIKLL